MQCSSAMCIGRAGLSWHGIKGIKYVPEFYIYCDSTYTENDKGKGEGRIMGDLNFLFISIIFKDFL